VKATSILGAPSSAVRPTSREACEDEGDRRVVRLFPYAGKTRAVRRHRRGVGIEGVRVPHWVPAIEQPRRIMSGLREQAGTENETARFRIRPETDVMVRPWADGRVIVILAIIPP